MPKGDGWAVRRYMCPICRLKGLYCHNFGGYATRWRCMYRNRQPHPSIINDEDVKDVNPILLTEPARWKP